MSAIQKMRTALQKHLRETPKEILQQQFDELNKIEWEGLSAQTDCTLFERQNLQVGYNAIILPSINLTSLKR
jgi:hypothetical protein